MDSLEGVYWSDQGDGLQRRTFTVVPGDGAGPEVVGGAPREALVQTQSAQSMEVDR